jgi:Uma2 family endonuclease
MSTITAPKPVATPRVPPFPVQQLTVQKYHEMIQKGILTEDDAVELLEGWIVPKMPRDPEHDTAIDLIAAALRLILPQGWRVRVQSAITTDDSEPEPDIAVVYGELRAFVTQHPRVGDIGLLAESSRSSLGIDSVDKPRIYARAGIAVYWVVNLIDRQVEVFTDPDPHANPPAYRNRQAYRHGQMIPVSLRGQTIGNVAVQDLLP